MARIPPLREANDRFRDLGCSRRTVRKRSRALHHLRESDCVVSLSAVCRHGPPPPEFGCATSAFGGVDTTFSASLLGERSRSLMQTLQATLTAVSWLSVA